MADTDYTSGFRAGQANEQQRIIQLIENWWDNTKDNPITLIELIKEGNK
jgi:hypothetical protein